MAFWSPLEPHHKIQDLLSSIDNDTDAVALTVVNFFANGQLRQYPFSVAGRFTEHNALPAIHPLMIHRIQSTYYGSLLYSQIHGVATVKNNSEIPLHTFCGHAFSYDKPCFIGLLVFHYKTKSYDEFQLKCVFVATPMMQTMAPLIRLL